MKYPDTIALVESIRFPITVQVSHNNNIASLSTGFRAIFPTTCFPKHNALCLFSVFFQLFQNYLANNSKELLLGLHNQSSPIKTMTPEATVFCMIFHINKCYSE